MPTPVKRTTRPVRIFSVNPVHGRHRFKLADLKKVVSNFQRYQSSPVQQVTQPRAVFIPREVVQAAIPFADVGIGHDPDQLIAKAILSRTDLPNCGRPVKLWMIGPDLYADLDGVPEELADMCDAGLYSDVSAEIYPDYVDPSGRRYGPLLKRISLLGSTPPRLKGLGPIPPFEYSDPPRNGRAGQNCVAVFSEGPTMTEVEARELLAKMGIDAPEGIPDVFLIMIASKLKELLPPEAEETTPEEEITAPTQSTAGQAPMTPEQFSERFGPSISAVVAKAIAPFGARLAGIEKTVNSVTAHSDQQALEVFAETNRDRLFPYERDPKNPSYIITRLRSMPADMRQKEMKAIEARPKVMMFSEQITDPMAGDSGQEEHGKIITGTDGPVSPTRRAQLMGMSKVGRQILARERRPERN